MFQTHKIAICLLMTTTFAYGEILELSCEGRRSNIVNNTVVETKNTRMNVQIAIGNLSVAELFPLDKLSKEVGTKILNTDMAIAYNDDLKKSTFMNIEMSQSASDIQSKTSSRAAQSDNFFKGDHQLIYKLTTSNASLSSSTTLEINRNSGSITFIDKSIIPSSPDVVNFYEDRVTGKCDLVSNKVKKF